MSDVVSPPPRRTRTRLVTFNTPFAMRIVPEVAEEIGFNESIVFLQLEYLISISTHDRDGERWTRQTLEDLRVHFPWWSLPTINRVIRNLEERDLITIANHNRNRRDRASWYALNRAGVQRLRSIRLVDDASDAPESQPAAVTDDISHHEKCEPESEAETDAPFNDLRNATDQNDHMQPIKMITCISQNDQMLRGRKTPLKTPLKTPPPPQHAESEKWAGAWERGEGEGGEGNEDELPHEEGVPTHPDQQEVGGSPHSAPPPNSLERATFVAELEQLGVRYASKLTCQPSHAALRKARQMAQQGDGGGRIYTYLAEFGATLIDDPATTTERTTNQYQAAFRELLDQHSIPFDIAIEVVGAIVTVLLPTDTAAKTLRPQKALLEQLVAQAVGFVSTVQWRVPTVETVATLYVKHQPQSPWAAGGAA